MNMVAKIHPTLYRMHNSDERFNDCYIARYGINHFSMKLGTIIEVTQGLVTLLEDGEVKSQDGLHLLIQVPELSIDIPMYFPDVAIPQRMCNEFGQEDVRGFCGKEVVVYTMFPTNRPVGFSIPYHP